jgi:phosphatidylglycerophosphate synthase
MKKILNLRGDDTLTKIILENFSVFKFIHPNLITMVGLLLNFLIIHEISISGNFFLVCLFLLLRYLADCLDGGVARMYDKKSKIGGALDTWSDTILIYISVAGIFFVYEIPWGGEVAAFLSCLNLYLMSLSGSLVDHAGMKLGGGLWADLYAFLINNSFILFGLKVLVLYFPMA